MLIALDAMGGDSAPRETVAGAVRAVTQPVPGVYADESLPDDFGVALVGDRAALEPLLDEMIAEAAAAGADADAVRARIIVEHASQVIGMSDSPVEGLKRYPDSSIARSVGLVAAGKAAAVVTAGNTGASVAATHQALGRIKGIRRPGIAVQLPSLGEKPALVVDVGATVKCQPIHLFHFGVMGHIFARSVMHIEKPRVGLLNIGEEDAKGNELVRATRDLFAESPLHFIGNIEGQDISRGKCDVVVCEGFVGNVVLKVSEGIAEFLTETLGKLGRELGSDSALALVKNLRERTDFSTYGGAILLGVSGTCIICHGRSDRRAIANAIFQALTHAHAQVTERITQGLSSDVPTGAR